jgi:hypothetical protein
MPRYRKKPVVIEAVRFIGGVPTEVDGPEPQWYEAARTIDRGSVGSLSFVDGKMAVMTLEGEIFALPGDYIIRGVKGKLYPCKPDIFEATYKRADESQ